MAIFGQSKRTTTQRLQESAWSNEADKKTLLEQFRAENPKPADFAFLLGHGDPGCRALASVLVRAHPTAEMLELLVREAEGKQEALRKWILSQATALPAATVTVAVDKMIDPRAGVGVQRAGWQIAMELPPESRRPYVEKGLKSQTATGN